MAGEWRQGTLGEFVSLQRGHDLTELERKGGTIPIMGSAGQNGYHDTALAKGPGVVIGRSGASFGQVHYCPVDYWPHNTALYVTDFHGNAQRFAYYLLKSINFTKYNSGSAQPSLNRNFIYPIEVNIPCIDDQNAIANVLGTLDDKIDLSQRMNETLESIARVIFRSWFVNFDPVHAKAGGEAPESICRRLGLTPHILSLFPDRFQKTEFGEIPEGWEVRPVGEVVQVAGGATPSTKTSEFWKGGCFYWATPKDLSALRAPVLIETERKITELGLKQISSGLLPVGTLLLSSRAPIGYLAISEVPVAVNQGFIAIICKNPISPEYMLNWCQFNMEIIKQRAGGTTFAEISKSAFRPIPLLVPTAAVLRSFSNIVKPLYSLITEHSRDIRTLGKIRDALLPKLISGELRVPSVEENR